MRVRARNISFSNLGHLPNTRTLALKARRRKAQEKNDIAEEARLCNAIGAIYTKKGGFTVQTDQ